MIIYDNRNMIVSTIICHSQRTHLYQSGTEDSEVEGGLTNEEKEKDSRRHENTKQNNVPRQRVA